MVSMGIYLMGYNTELKIRYGNWSFADFKLGSVDISTILAKIVEMLTDPKWNLLGKHGADRLFNIHTFNCLR
jgi:hypothetical protein